MTFSVAKFAGMVQTMTPVEMAMAFKTLELAIGTHLVAQGIPSENVDQFVAGWATGQMEAVNHGQELGLQIKAKPSVRAAAVVSSSSDHRDARPPQQRHLRQQLALVLDRPRSRQALIEELGVPSHLISACLSREKGGWFVSPERGTWERGELADQWVAQNAGRPLPDPPQERHEVVGAAIVQVLQDGSTRRRQDIATILAQQGGPYTDIPVDELAKYVGRLLAQDRDQLFEKASRGRYRLRGGPKEDQQDLGDRFLTILRSAAVRQGFREFGLADTQTCPGLEDAEVARGVLDSLTPEHILKIEEDPPRWRLRASEEDIDEDDFAGLFSDDGSPSLGTDPSSPSLQ